MRHLIGSFGALTYIVSRSAGDDPIVLTADRQPTDIAFKAGGVFRADIYSQNEVECIADCTTSQLVLLDNFEIDSRLDHVRSSLTANANQIVPLQSRIAALSVSQYGKLRYPGCSAATWGTHWAKPSRRERQPMPL